MTTPSAAALEAQALLDAGFRVWPISRRTLTPARAGFSRAAGPDVTAAAADFTDDHEVGVLCGPCPAVGPGARLVCVDYDGPVPADQRLGGAGGPPTLTSKGGAHAWFRVPPGVTGFRQTQAIRAGVTADGTPWAVDTRDFGGYARETKNGEPLWDPPGASTAEWPRDLTQAEVDELFGPAGAPADAPAEPRPAVGTPATRPSVESTNALATRWHTNPDGTNQLAGAVGAVLGGAWGWSDDQVREYFETWLQHPQLSRHLGSALRAAERYRAGERIYGFPKLKELLGGRDFVPAASGAAAASVEELWAELAPEAEPPPGPAAPGAEPDPTGWGFEVGTVTAAWDPPVVPWVCEGLCLAPGAPGLITGYGGSGKTTLVQHLALCVVSGRPLLGRWPVRQGAVTHLDYEQGADLTRRRYLTLGLGDLPAEAQARLRFASLPTRRLTDDDAAVHLLRAAQGQTLLIVDSLVAASSLDDENAADARRPLDLLGRVSAVTGCAVLVIHHSKKDRSNGRTSARGSSAITDAVSVHLTYEKNDEAGVTSPARLGLQKVRHILPPGAATEGFSVGQTGAGVLFVVDEDDARDDARDGRAADAPADPQIIAEVKRLMVDGWSGSANQLVSALGRRRGDVLDAVRDLTQNGIIQYSGTRLKLVPR